MYSGMFISEVSEALYCGVEGTQAQVNESNDAFAALLGKAIVRGSLKEAFTRVKEDYSILASTNPIAQYNSERWYLNS